MVYSPDNAKHPPKNNSLSPNTQHLPPQVAFIVIKLPWFTVLTMLSIPWKTIHYHLTPNTYHLRLHLL